MISGISLLIVLLGTALPVAYVYIVHHYIQETEEAEARLSEEMAKKPARKRRTRKPKAKAKA